MTKAPEPAPTPHLSCRPGVPQERPQKRPIDSSVCRHCEAMRSNQIGLSV